MSSQTDNYPAHDRSRFYKYVSAETAKIVLETKQVRYSSPLVFNDPFDVQTGLYHSFDLDQLPQRLMDRFEELVMADAEPPFVPNVPGAGMSRAILRARQYRPTHGFPRERWEELATPQLEAIVQEFKDHHKQFQHFWLDRLPRMRVFCVAEDNDNLLMWAHYGKDHTGAVFELRVMPEVDNHLCAATPVIYDEQVPTPFTERHFLDAICGLAALQLDNLAVHYARVKSSIWAYEKEWRLYDLLDQPEDKLFSEYPVRDGEISAIYLGCQITPDNKREIIRLGGESYPDAKLFEAAKAIGRYGLDFRPIE